jgi:predicted ATP-grasp superfamily ATP-dependent carboligase
MRDLQHRRLIVLSPELSQSFAIADLLTRQKPALPVLGYPLDGEQGAVRRPFKAYVDSELGELAIRQGDAIITGSAATEYVLRAYETIVLGEIRFERKNLWFFDKPATLRRAAELGVPIPQTWMSYDEVADKRMPVFYKPAREGTGGVRGRASTPAMVPQIARVDGYLFQEIVEGPSVIGFGFVSDRGKVLASCLHHEILSYPPSGGSAVAVEPFVSPRVEELASRIIADFQYSGWGLVEFKPCRLRRDFVLMELNAKFWASIEFTFRTCPDFARLLFGITTVAEPIRRMVWPARLLRSGLPRLPTALGASLPGAFSREPLTWRDFARMVLPARL